MPRLRITVSLSLLALAIGVGATAVLTAWPRWHDRAAQTTAAADAGAPPTTLKHAPSRQHSRHVAQSPAPTPLSVPATPPPRAVYMPSPRYPVEAARAHREGVVTLRVQLNMAGQVLAVRVALSSGDAQLDASAHKAVLRWRFQPSATPPAPLLLPVRFRLAVPDASQ